MVPLWLEKVGWLLQHGGVSGQEARERSGEYLAAELNLPVVVAEEKAEERLAFWEDGEDRGILERLTAGTREALVFVHVQLGEYAGPATPLVSIEKNSFGGSGR